jgi:proton-translocating NADH-quinone oxidoreductase chain L
VSPDFLQQIVEAAPGIVALPFLAALVIILGGWRSKTLSMILSVGAVAIGFAYSLYLFWAIGQNPHLVPWYINKPWFVSSTFTLSMGVLVDNLVAIMFIVVTTVSLLVQIYTHGYMREDPGYSRFYAYLSLFTGSMLGLVVATNLFETYFFWELVGVCSYFLIGFWWYKTSASEACLKAFIVNRIGDCGFLIGIFMLLGATKDFWGGNPVLAFVGPSGFDLANVIQNANNAHVLSADLLTVISLFVLLGPIAKSAQFPLHVWLPDAMEGPTPISALIHAATMVAAGVYLVARAYPLWLSPEGHAGTLGLAVIAGIGGFTAFMAATIALSQFDIKRILAWSTVSQLGYMFVGLGAGAYSGAIFHLFNHAFFKAMLFLCSGTVIHGLHGEQDIRKMGGLWKHMPITWFCFLIGTVSISGCPLLSGFFSKDEIISAACKYNVWLGGVTILTALLTAFYMFRVYFMTFHNEYRGHAKPHESPAVMTFPLIALAVPSICSGYVGVNPQAWTGLTFDGKAAAAVANHFASFIYFGRAPEFEGVNGLIVGWSTFAAVVGFIMAWTVYMSGAWKINEQITASKNMLVTAVYRVSYNKWFFDDIYLWLVQSLVLPTFNTAWQWVDRYIVDNLVNFAALVSVSVGEILRLTQNGRAQTYALVIFGWVAGLTFFAYLFSR